MDVDTRDLIRALCARAGMMMEDASLLAVSIPSQENGKAQAALAQLESDARAIVSLIAAATELTRWQDATLA